LDPRTSGRSGLWGQLVKLSYKWLGDTVFDKKAEICNCGGDFGYVIPRPELVKREGMTRREEKMQLYGAAMYWHLATVTTERYREANPELLRDKDVLEVACMRGGGARYLAEVAGPRRYLAVDLVQENIDRCRRDHGEWPGLDYEVMDAHDLALALPEASFDFVICIQSAAAFTDMRAFIEGVAHVLRPGGRLMLADALTRGANTKMMDALEDFGFEVELTTDISRHVSAVGLCEIPRGLSYVHVVAQKE